MDTWFIFSSHFAFYKIVQWPGIQTPFFTLNCKIILLLSADLFISFRIYNLFYFSDKIKRFHKKFLFFNYFFFKIDACMYTTLHFLRSFHSIKFFLLLQTYRSGMIRYNLRFFLRDFYVLNRTLLLKADQFISFRIHN